MHFAVIETNSIVLTLFQNESVPEISSQLQSYVDDDREDLVDLNRQIELLQQQVPDKKHLYSSELLLNGGEDFCRTRRRIA